MTRVNQLEEDAVSWTGSFAKLIGVKAKEISIVHKSPRLLKVQFTNQGDADRFKKLLPRAGSLIPFFPATLSLSDAEEGSEEGNTVYVQRVIPIHFQSLDKDSFFQFSEMRETNGDLTKAYWSVWEDRILTLALALGEA